MLDMMARAVRAQSEIRDRWMRDRENTEMQKNIYK